MYGEILHSCYWSSNGCEVVCDSGILTVAWQSSVDIVSCKWIRCVVRHLNKFKIGIWVVMNCDICDCIYEIDYTVTTVILLWSFTRSILPLMVLYKLETILIRLPVFNVQKLARQLDCCVLVVFTNMQAYVTTGSQNLSLTQLRIKTNAKQVHKYTYRRHLTPHGRNIYHKTMILNI